MAALLAKLAVDGPTPRAHAAAMLWPDADDKSARNNLRQRLFRLRQAAQRDVVVPDTTLALTDGIAHDLSDLSSRLADDPDAASGELLGTLSFDDCIDLADWVASRASSGRSRAATRWPRSRHVSNRKGILQPRCVMPSAWSPMIRCSNTRIGA